MRPLKTATELLSGDIGRAQSQWNAKINAIAFAQWLMKNYESSTRYNIWYSFKKEKGTVTVDQEYTTEQLYELFIHSQVKP